MSTMPTQGSKGVQAEGQEVNKYAPRLVTYNGVTHSLAQWARILGIPRITLAVRLHRGWSVEEAFEVPVQQRCYYHKD